MNQRRSLNAHNADGFGNTHEKPETDSTKNTEQITMECTNIMITHEGLDPGRNDVCVVMLRGGTQRYFDEDNKILLLLLLLVVKIF